MTRVWLAVRKDGVVSAQIIDVKRFTLEETADRRIFGLASYSGKRGPKSVCGVKHERRCSKKLPCKVCQDAARAKFEEASE